MYEIGTIKLTWINPSDYTLLESKMYNKRALKKALQDAQSKPNWMIFELVKTQNDEYEWKLLPYGEADRFVQSMQLSKSVLMPYVGLAIIGFAAYGIYKVIKR